MNFRPCHFLESSIKAPNSSIWGLLTYMTRRREFLITFVWRCSKTWGYEVGLPCWVPTAGCPFHGTPNPLGKVLFHPALIFILGLCHSIISPLRFRTFASFLTKVSSLFTSALPPNQYISYLLPWDLQLTQPFPGSGSHWLLSFIREDIAGFLSSWRSLWDPRLHQAYWCFLDPRHLYPIPALGHKAFHKISDLTHILCTFVLYSTISTLLPSPLGLVHPPTGAPQRPHTFSPCFPRLAPYFLERAKTAGTFPQLPVTCTPYRGPVSTWISAVNWKTWENSKHIFMFFSPLIESVQAEAPILRKEVFSTLPVEISYPYTPSPLSLLLQISKYPLIPEASISSFLLVPSPVVLRLILSWKGIKIPPLAQHPRCPTNHWIPRTGVQERHLQFTCLPEPESSEDRYISLLGLS